MLRNMSAMSAPASPVTSERYDFRSVVISGTKLGLMIGVAVVLFLAASRVLPAGIVRQLGQTLVVVIAGLAAAFLPASWVAARTGEGIAGAAAVGLWGTVVFSAFDIAVLRPLKAYPWTWDAVGGYSTWWYLPMWWMLGTFSAWMGALVAAHQPDGTAARRLVTPTVIAGFILGVALMLVVGVALPVATGAGLVLALTARALVALARG
jgi:hypothetical protein